MLVLFFSEIVTAGLLAFPGGVMVDTSLDGPPSAAHKYGESHSAIAGIGLDMQITAVRLILL